MQSKILLDEYENNKLVEIWGLKITPFGKIKKEKIEQSWLGSKNGNKGISMKSSHLNVS